MTAYPFTEQAIEAVVAWRRQHGIVVASDPLPSAPVEDAERRSLRHEIATLRARCELLAKQEEAERRRAEDAEVERESLRRTLANTRRQLDVANAQIRELGAEPVEVEEDEPASSVSWTVLDEAEAVRARARVTPASGWIPGGAR